MGVTIMQQTTTYCDRCKQFITSWAYLKGGGINDNWQLCFPCYEAFKEWLKG